MFERHFGLRENPFMGGHQLRFLYPSREHQEARAHLRYGIENREPFLLITGEVGTGKTTAIYDALAEWGSEVAVALITNSALTRQELLEEIGLRFGMSLPSGVSKPQALAQLERHLLAVRQRGAHAVLLLDEAQNLAPELLEEIRLLSNLEAQGDKLLQIFLVGQPELEAKLARAELRQLRQRITVHYRLNPLSPEETAGYIHHRLSVAGGNAWVVFPPDACGEVFRLTHGIPREINTVASAALLTAFAEGANSVRPEHVRAVAEEDEFRSVLGDAVETPELRLSAPLSPPSTMVSAQAPYLPHPVDPPAPRAADEPAARTWAQPAEPEGAQRSWGSKPTPQQPEPPRPAAQPWQPPMLEAVEPAPVERVERREIDAWSAAARDLLDARRRQESAPQPPIDVVVDERRFAPMNPEPPRVAPQPGINVMPVRARSEAADLSNLPPRLRDKLAAEAEAGEQPRNITLPLLIAASVVAVLGVSGVLMQRFGVIDVPMLRGLAGAPTQQAPIVPLDSTKVGAPQTAPDTTKSVPPASAPVPAVVAPAVTKPATAAIARDTLNTYGIAVGTYLDEERAIAERDRLGNTTGLAGRVLPYRDSGVTMYRLVLGNWSSRSAAEKRADLLVAGSQVNEARVLLLGRTAPR